MPHLRGAEGPLDPAHMQARIIDSGYSSATITRIPEICSRGTISEGLGLTTFGGRRI